MRTLYFDCFSGISGDMVIGALLDAGGDPQNLVEELKKLHFEDEYELAWKKVVKNGITSTKFDVILKNDSNMHTHHHDHEHTHHHEHHHDHEHTHDHVHEHIHTHEHSHDHHHGHGHDHHSHDHDHHHHHSHRAYKDIVKMIEESELALEVKEIALKIFKKIGEAEGLIHGLPLEKVHFHEVGAVDSIIDIVGTAILLQQLEITTIKSSSVPVGTGKIHIDHGIYPVPAPATLEILKGVPIEQSDIRFELTTPTGAGIISVLTDEFCSFPSMKVRAIGYGAGTKTFKDRPNVLRVIIGE
ncbi:LarC family nickel insertion protein [Fredinandcohnia sp. QZ13]|uniref:LarC family nickel insertion protein n=1 Tax=Fredinandcohnia sp. QZ13 TaxID=3073144 RepID=UPI002853566A|nr:LarC family nickel insertion protein [Fredinandcohnia sp. QZ13]MDR4886336.1 LarC family nickel insertion protein [Fredinandcohnia sp. QZ13]